MGSVRVILRAIRNFLFSSVNREFLIFLFFLALSAIFWLMMTLNEIYEEEFDVPVKVVNVPDDVVLTSDDTDTLKVTLRDRGFILVGYYASEDLEEPLQVDFASYNKAQANTCAVSGAELQRLLYKQLLASTKVTAMKPDRMEFTYNHGTHKRVPVAWRGKVKPEGLYYIARVTYSPDSVDVYASQAALDSINVIYTEALSQTDFRDTLVVNAKLEHRRGVKVVPDKVTVSFFTDVLTEESIDDVPIQGINMPEGKVLRTFPNKVTVRFVTGVNQYRNLTAKDFTVVVDYNEIRRHPSEKCTVRVKGVPHGIVRASADITQVDYLIEEE